MKIQILIIIKLILVAQLCLAQIDNSKTILVKNNVKSVLEEMCHGSCTAQYAEYDRKGNLVEFNFFRAGTLNRYKYDEDGNRLMTFWIDKSDTTKIDTLYPKDFIPRNDNRFFFEEYNENGHQLIKTWQDEKIIIEYNEHCNLVSEIRFKANEIIHQSFINYDEQQRILEQKIINKKSLKWLNKGREENEKIDAIIKRYKYNDKGQIIELYTYFSDPCMGIDNHFNYIYNYHDGGLIESAEAYGNTKKLAFTLGYEYEFYK